MCSYICMFGRRASPNYNLNNDDTACTNINKHLHKSGTEHGMVSIETFRSLIFFRLNRFNTALAFLNGYKLDIRTLILSIQISRRQQSS